MPHLDRLSRRRTRILRNRTFSPDRRDINLVDHLVEAYGAIHLNLALSLKQKQVVEIQIGFEEANGFTRQRPLLQRGSSL